MQHPSWQSFRDSSEYEADHRQKHIEWDAFVEKHEAECPKAQALIPTTDEF
jgi:hypothetical protein